MRKLSWPSLNILKLQWTQRKHLKLFSPTPLRFSRPHPLPRGWIKAFDVLIFPGAHQMIGSWSFQHHLIKSQKSFKLHIADLSLQADDFYFMFWWVQGWSGARKQWLHSYLFMVISLHYYRSYHIPNVETGAIRCSTGHSFYQAYTVRSKRIKRAKLRIYASPVFDCFCVSVHGSNG